MKIYDISQEIFGCCVYPGDPAPQREILNKMDDGGLYNLTAFSMCAHNGTHVDAPFHFIRNGKPVDAVGLEPFVGDAWVVAHNGVVTAEDARRMLDFGAARILIKGRAEVSLEAAREFAQGGICLLGNESQSVGPETGPMAVHLVLLGAGVCLLEGIRLEEVPEGKYLLNAAPLNLAGADGAPCRAILMDFSNQ